VAEITKDSVHGMIVSNKLLEAKILDKKENANRAKIFGGGMNIKRYVKKQHEGRNVDSISQFDLQNRLGRLLKSDNERKKKISKLGIN